MIIAACVVGLILLIVAAIAAILIHGCRQAFKEPI